MKEGKGNTELIITRHDQFIVPINVMNFYGKQECRSKKEEINEDWNIILEEITEIENREEYVVLMSDMNFLLGNFIKGNTSDKKNYGGTLLIEFLENKNYILLNNADSINNPNTRYDPGDPSNKDKWSCLDLVIISAELLKYVSKLTIDQSLAFTPFYIDKNEKTVYTDHFSCLLSFNNIPLKQSEIFLRPPKSIQWNLNKEGGWEKYLSLTSNNKRLEDIIKDEK